MLYCYFQRNRLINIEYGKLKKEAKKAPKKEVKKKKPKKKWTVSL